VIDLQPNMHNVRVDPDTKLAYVSGGCLWEDVDEATTKHGKYKHLHEGSTYISDIMFRLGFRVWNRRSHWCWYVNSFPSCSDLGLTPLRLPNTGG
jgi:FAD/FMN-containing dehydrogenase